MAIGDNNFRRFVSPYIFLGRGSFGEVYGPCDYYGKKCAVKQRWLNNATKEDIEKELAACETWMSLHHKSLIAVYALSLETHAVYIMMEYASGGSLHAFLSKYESDLPFEIQMDWSIQIADGMAHLHESSIVHRDLKSPNIVIMEEGALSNPCEKTLKITDFDQIREHDGTKSMTKAGTYAWTAPEFLKDVKFSKASDVWSYGVVLWEIITRDFPYKGVPEQLIFVQAEAGLLKSKIPSSCSHIMKYFIERCLSVEKEQRPSFKEILEHLKGYLSADGEDPTRYDCQEKRENPLNATDGSRPKTVYEKKLVFFQNRTFLEERMDPDFGLLDNLRTNKIIDLRETEDIKMEGTTCKRNTKLLDYMLAKDRIDGLLAALEATHQKHLVNYLRANGEYSDEFGEEWPLTEKEISILDSNHQILIDLLDGPDLHHYMFSSRVINSRQREIISSKPTSHERSEAMLEILRRRSLRDYRQTIIFLRQSQQNQIADILQKGGVSADGEDPKRYDCQEKEKTQLNLYASDGSRPKTLTEYEKKLLFLKNRTFLEERMDPDFGLLDILRAYKIIDFREMDDIKMEGTACKRNTKLLNYILAKDRYDGLLSALGATHQIHLVNYLRANGEYSDEFDEEWPLTEKEISILDTKKQILIDLLDVSDLLLRLFSSMVINNRQKELISSKPTVYDQNEALLEILRRRSMRDYRETMRCLHESQQSYIASLLMEGGVVVRDHRHQDAEDVAVDEDYVTILSSD